MRQTTIWLFELVLCLLAGLLLSACRNAGPSSLINGFTSYQNIQQVRKELEVSGFGADWSEHRDKVEPGDKRSRHDMVVLSGHFRHLGHDGTLTLTLFNDRLMTAEFSPANGAAYLAALRRELKGTPQNPKEQVVISQHTNFIYYVDPDGSLRFIWEDSKLAQEWRAWVRENS